jgi:hypothetical protein
MTLVDVRWGYPVNVITVLCDCGQTLYRPSNYSQVWCLACGRKEYWHSCDPKPKRGRWSGKVMANLVLTRDFDPVKAEAAK